MTTRNKIAETIRNLRLAEEAAKTRNAHIVIQTKEGYANVRTMDLDGPIPVVIADFGPYAWTRQRPKPKQEKHILVRAIETITLDL